jgi:flagellar M-ring protein FliF
MGELKNKLNGTAQKWRELENGKKTAIIITSCVIVTAIIISVSFLTKPKYEPLFTNMAPEDMAKVAEQLKQDKVDYKLEGTTILVPKDKVEDTRLSVISAGTLPSEGKGFELFDENKFGITDSESKVMYQRALETELERTIKAFDEVEYARVHLNMSEPSAFVRDEQPASASVTLKFKNNKKITDEQVKSIIALVSKSVKNLPEENVVVVDSHFNYLSENLNNDDITSSTSIENRYEIQREFESKLEDNLRKTLEAVYGSNSVKTTVKADLDFDSKQTSTIKYDEKGVAKNQNTIKETIKSGGDDVSGSPIDNNMSNTMPANNGGTSKNREETTTNYNVGQVEERVIKAPGEVKRLSTSVVVDGALSDAEKETIRNIVTSAIGFDQNRGDVVSVEGIKFDDTVKKQVEADLKDLSDKQAAEEKRKKLMTNVILPIALSVALIAIIIALRKKRSSEIGSETPGVDVVVDNPEAINEVLKSQVFLEDDENKSDLTAELKKYATKKPDQVVEIIKSWLAEDER